MKLMPWIKKNRAKIDICINEKKINDEHRRQYVLAYEPLYQEFRSQASWEEAN